MEKQQQQQQQQPPSKSSREKRKYLYIHLLLPEKKINLKISFGKSFSLYLHLLFRRR